MRLTSVSKRFARGRWVLTEVDLDITPGRVIVITGPNGSGKSTLLNIVAGITRPSAGAVTGRPRSIGYVPERFPVRTALSVAGYLRHMGRIRGLSTDVATRRVAELMERFDLSGENSELRALSKGNAQRVGLIQALLVRPVLLILDEPSTGLDQLGHDILAQTLDEVARNGGAVVLGSPLESGSPVGAICYELTDGRLRAAAQTVSSGANVLRIVLRGGPDSRVPPEPWSTYLSPQPTGAEIAATVPRAISDRFLSAALSCGWSVLSVGPHGTAAADQGGAPAAPTEPRGTSSELLTRGEVVRRRRAPPGGSTDRIPGRGWSGATAIYRYLLADVTRGQRYLAPLLLFGVVVAVGSRGDGGPLLPLYGLWTAAMFICAVWLTMVVLADEDPVQERITAVNARRRWHPLVAAITVVLSFCLLLTIIGLGYPLIVGVRPASAADLVVGGLSQLAAACFGATVGLFCSRRIIPRPGYALLLAALLILALLLIGWVPLVNALIRLLSTGLAGSEVLPQVVAIGVVSVAMLAGGVAAVHAIAARR